MAWCAGAKFVDVHKPGEMFEVGAAIFCWAGVWGLRVVSMVSRSAPAQGSSRWGQLCFVLLVPACSTAEIIAVGMLRRCWCVFTVLSCVCG